MFGSKRILKLLNKDKEFFTFVITIVGQKLRIIPDAGQFFYCFFSTLKECQNNFIIYERKSF